MNYSRTLFEMVLTEAVALTKGSQRVMNDKKLVANLADAIRDDARSHPVNFPPGAARSWQKAPDEQLARWFLENIDAIEKEGYENVVYSRDGVYADWIVRRYIAGSHNWEDLTGVMNMNLRDWTLLKNRNMLDPNHKDLPKFNSVRDVGFYMTTHYSDKLEDIRTAAKNAARAKLSKSIKLVDNDDYRIYTTLNRAAGCALGLGTQWCTANSQNDTHYHNYSNRAMLFQLFPYLKEQKEDGTFVTIVDDDGKKELNQKEKYQFDAGGPNFMDITDNPPRGEIIRTKYPYIFDDLATALKTKKAEIEKAFADLSIDPTLQEKDFKIKTYEIDEEIKKLHKFVERGFFTEEKRKKAKPKPEEGEAPPEGTPPPQEPPVQEEEEMDPAAIATGGNLGTMGGGAGPTGGGKYPPGTAPTMPESFNYKGNITMEEVDKDVAAMLTSLKKYDMLAESVAPVLGMKTLGEKAEAKEEKEEVEEKEELDEKEENPWEKLGAEDKKETKPGDKTKTHKGGEVTKTEKGIVHKGKYGSDKGKKVDEAVEEADADILNWMSRFSKLGNMKGYGK
jgi:hypothetical protein